MKESIGFISIILILISYAPYLRDIIKGKTKPHIYSYFIWGFLTTIIFALQVTHGGGAGAYVTLAATILIFIVFILSLRNGFEHIKLSDTAFFISALVATGVWIFAKQPVVSTILLCLIDLLGFAPTVRKSWNKPHEETLFTWSLNSFRHGLSIFALGRYSIITLLYPVLWTIANALFSFMLVIRRRKIRGIESTTANDISKHSFSN